MLRKGALSVTITSALTVAGVLVGAVTTASAESEPRLRRAENGTRFSGASPKALSRAERENLLQPWWPSRVFIPTRNTTTTPKDNLGRPLYFRALPVGDIGKDGFDLGDDAKSGPAFRDLPGVSGIADNAYNALVRSVIPFPEPLDWQRAGFDGSAMISGSSFTTSASNDLDRDGERDPTDECPADPEKEEPGRCGCGFIDPADGTVCTDPAGATPSEEGSEEKGELRILRLEKRSGAARQFRLVTKTRPTKVGGGKQFEAVLTFALPRFPRGDYYFIESNEELGENAFVLNEGDEEARTYADMNLAESEDTVDYSCTLQSKVGTEFKNKKAATPRQRGAMKRYLNDQAFAFPLFEVSFTKFSTADEYRIACTARNQNTGISVDFFSKPFDLKKVSKANQTL